MSINLNFKSLTSIIDENDTEESASYDLVIPEFEKILFEKREKGNYIIFHPSVIGMAPVYKIGKYAFITLKDNFFYLKEFIHNIFTFGEDELPYQKIVLPDKGAMNLLKTDLSSSQYRNLQSFYQDLHRTGKRIVPSGLIISKEDGYHDLEKITYFILENRFNNKLPVFHNGIRLLKGQEKELKNKDVIRIGSSIMFGYFKI
jgi:hypothetical protein